LVDRDDINGFRRSQILLVSEGSLWRSGHGVGSR